MDGHLQDGITMIKLDKTTQPKIHSRQIDCSIYEGPSDTLIVEGILRDERLMSSYRRTGEFFPPGTIHHMIIRMAVTTPDLVIEDIDVEMPTLPNEACIETRQCLAVVKGMSIARGFTSKVKKMAGGVKGCSHLLALLTAMAPAAFQGAFSAMERQPRDADVNPRDIIAKMKNTCWVWREDGPIVEQLLKK